MSTWWLLNKGGKKPSPLNERRVTAELCEYCTEQRNHTVKVYYLSYCPAPYGVIMAQSLNSAPELTSLYNAALLPGIKISLIFH